MRSTSDLHETLDAVLSTALDAAIAMKEDGSIARWNHVAERTFGWTFAEVHGKLVSEVIIPPEFRPSHAAGLKRYLETGVPRYLGRHVEVIAVDRAGRRFATELSSTEVHHNGERLFLGFIRDISQRKEADARISEVTERLNLAVRTHSIGIFDTDVTCAKVYWDPELERIYGYGPGEFAATIEAWRLHVIPADLDRVTKQFDTAIAARASELAYNYRIRRRDGEIRHVEASARFFYDAAGKNTRRVGVNIDVTSRKQTERRLFETQAELAHLSRLGSLGAMASSLGHELNQPLTAVANYLSAAKSLLKNDLGADFGKALEALELASANTMRAAELIRRLRAMSLKQPMQRQITSLATIVNETASLALPNGPLSGVSIDVVIDPEADRVFADPLMVQQVIFNLLRNAAEAMSSIGGKISVRASLLDEQFAMLSVADNGPGLDPEVKAQLFTAFVSTKSDGMGVGLSICRTIIESQDGKIWARSSPEGTIFYFTLPRESLEENSA
ncbi:MAG: PAS domain S-box protein [Sphingosinicella sp.]|nr:PAS domain S-box protein [Sphingosinicella sp.]